MITLEESKHNQAEMQAQGRRLINTTPIVKIFSRYGDYRLGGSYQHGTMIFAKPDIDGYIVVETVELEAGMALLGELIQQDSVRRIAIEKESQRGIGLQVKVPFEGRMWNFDVHFVVPSELKAVDYLGHVTFTQYQAETMMFLKAQLYERGLYPGSTKLPGSFSSFDVYSAVLDDNVTSVEEMIAWGKVREMAADKFRRQNS
ncbi:hypothetical protein HJC99_01750 [Candidatus Saccharibacteria bacterium]|nr:hypothetical protein [Candidatus Saccharibacteria bacterium]